jgi:hypothetical protein
MRKQSHKAPSPINCAACACIASSSACPKVSATRSPTSASESPCSLPGFTIVSCALAHPLAGSPVTRNAEIDPPPRLRCSDSEIQCGPVVALGCRTEMPAFTESFGIYYHDLEQRNRPVKSLDAKILKAPIRICAECNTTRTQPHDRAWEQMCKRLRERQPPLLVRANRIFPQNARREMKNVHLFFLKLFGCMICEAKANGHEVPIDIAPFSNAIMSSQLHPEVYLQFGKCDGTVGRSNLHCWTTDRGSVLAG